MIEHNVSYTHTNTYSTLNSLSDTTENVWFVLHGMGYLTKYFIKYFEQLDPKKNFVIAPQAPSKYYQDKKFKYVGASWLTKENTETEKENVFNYLDAVWEAESAKRSLAGRKIIFMGYSQGVSIISRWMASRKIVCDYLLLHSGAIPQELTPADFNFLPATTPVTYLYGDQDEYITEARKTEQQLKGNDLFGSRLQLQVFKGKHEVYVPFINDLSLAV